MKRVEGLIRATWYSSGSKKRQATLLLALTEEEWMDEMKRLQAAQNALQEPVHQVEIGVRP
jgi:hypothetical protein